MLFRHYSESVLTSICTAMIRWGFLKGVKVPNKCQTITGKICIHPGFLRIICTYLSKSKAYAGVWSCNCLSPPSKNAISVSVGI